MNDQTNYERVLRMMGWEQRIYKGEPVDLWERGARCARGTVAIAVPETTLTIIEKLRELRDKEAEHFLVLDEFFISISETGEDMPTLALTALIDYYEQAGWPEEVK